MSTYPEEFKILEERINELEKELEHELKVKDDSYSLASIETEIIDKLFLELSQFTGAKTSEELRLDKQIKSLEAENEKLQEQLNKNCNCDNPIDHTYCNRCRKQWES